MDFRTTVKSMNFSRFSSLRAIGKRKSRPAAIHERKKSKACQNCLLAATIIQFIILIGICASSLSFGNEICELFMDSNIISNTTVSNIGSTNCMQKGKLKSKEEYLCNLIRKYTKFLF